MQTPFPYSYWLDYRRYIKSCCQHYLCLRGLKMSFNSILRTRKRPNLQELSMHQKLLNIIMSWNIIVFAVLLSKFYPIQFRLLFSSLRKIYSFVWRTYAADFEMGILWCSMLTVICAPSFLIIKSITVNQSNAQILARPRG